MKIEKWDSKHIYFTDGSTISYNHEKDNGIYFYVDDYRETNWADFSVLETSYNDEEFRTFRIEPINHYGFLLILELLVHDLWYHDYIPTKKIFIPCYSDQNGYHDKGLMITTKRPSGTIEEEYLECELRKSF